MLRKGPCGIRRILLLCFDSLVIKEVSPEDAGVYTVQCEDKESSAKLDVKGLQSYVDL